MFQTTNQIPKKNPSSSTELPHASGRVPDSEEVTRTSITEKPGIYHGESGFTSVLIPL